MKVTLRTRLALLSASAVALTIPLASGVAWWATQRSLRAGIDRSLVTGPLSAGPTALAAQIGSAFRPEDLCTQLQRASAQLQPTLATVRLLRPDGSSCGPADAQSVLVTSSERQASLQGRTSGPRDGRSTSGQHVRVYLVPLGDGYSVLLTRDLTEVDDTLRQLAILLALTTGLGVALAFAVGSAVSRTALRPVDRLTAAAEQIGTTLDLPVPLPEAGHHELARLSRAFNAMVEALTVARARQQQLVADASHELRTPLTSMRTNIELLLRSEQLQRPLPAETRGEILRSVQAQVQELALLVQELTVLAHHDVPTAAVQVDLAEIVRQAVRRAQHRGPRNWQLELQPWWVHGDPVLIERAILNIADNAVKFSPADSQISVLLNRGVLSISDAGPGIPEVERKQVFARFWRSPSARSLPGSGLGLAMVAELVQRMQGTVVVESSASAGVRVVVTLPGSSHGSEELGLATAQAVAGQSDGKPPAPITQTQGDQD